MAPASPPSQKPLLRSRSCVKGLRGVLTAQVSSSASPLAEDHHDAMVMPINRAMLASLAKSSAWSSTTLLAGSCHAFLVAMCGVGQGPLAQE